ncbi:hypothetical protein SAMN05880501_101801 [Ureibacillus xyleni]|uniref:Uncharacterized protein n=1 Tax=Ureibacillus xyleni TaxID=614648 RepID=A0A285RJH2_9BACL|nr:hypothetical protein SAMN05880501_101801 [Ureibacillus xyleni]
MVVKNRHVLCVWRGDFFLSYVIGIADKAGKRQHFGEIVCGDLRMVDER